MDFDVDMIFLSIEPFASLGASGVSRGIEHGYLIPVERTAAIETVDVTCDTRDHQTFAFGNLESRFTRAERNYLLALKKRAQSHHKFSDFVDLSHQRQAIHCNVSQEPCIARLVCPS